jgi:hypothetical protein
MLFYPDKASSKLNRESNQDFRASDLSGPIVAAVLIADCNELRIEVASILFQENKQMVFCYQNCSDLL